MNKAVLMRGFWMSFIYIYRAIFAKWKVNGISLSFFNNSINIQNSEASLNPRIIQMIV